MGSLFSYFQKGNIYMLTILTKSDIYVNILMVNQSNEKGF